MYNNTDNKPNEFPKQWIISVDTGMICDEYYPDFYIGQKIDFPVVFYDPKPRKYSYPGSSKCFLEKSDISNINAGIVDETDYMINGKTIYANENGWILDIGIRVAAKSGKRLDWIENNKYVYGRTFLQADWAEIGKLMKDQAAPPLVYTWHVDQIMVWDSEKLSFDLLSNTNGWQDTYQDKYVNYYLRCTKLDIELRKITTRAEKAIKKLEVFKQKYGIEK